MKCFILKSTIYLKIASERWFYLLLYFILLLQSVFRYTQTAHSFVTCYLMLLQLIIFHCYHNLDHYPHKFIPCTQIGQQTVLKLCLGASLRVCRNSGAFFSRSKGNHLCPTNNFLSSNLLLSFHNSLLLHQVKNTACAIYEGNQLYLFS